MKTYYAKIKSEIDKSQAIAIDLIKKGIDQKDVRVAFFELFQNYYVNLYRIYSYIDSTEFAKDSDQIYFNIQGKNDDKDIINLTAQLNYNLIIVTWSTFELCVSQICKKLLAVESKESLLMSNFKRIYSIVKSILLPEIHDKLVKKLKLSYLEHVSINLKTDKLFKDVSYEGFEKDKEFLLFYGKLRNSIHSNFVYYGKPFEYKFQSVTYTFESEKPIKQEPIDWSNDLSIFNLSVELRNIYNRIISNFYYKGLIFDPSYADSI